MATIVLTVLPQNEKAEFERNKIQTYGTRNVLDAREINYILYDGQEVIVAEPYEQLKEIIK